MAVWMQIIGLRKSESIDFDREKISLILNKMKKVNPKFDWKFESHNGVEYFRIQSIDQILKVYFDNPDFIEFSGYSLFQNWFEFADKNQAEITDKIRKVFRKIASDYGISELIYFSEWFFELGEIRNKKETFADLKKRIKDYPDLKSNELYGLESNEYYIEKISPVANIVSYEKP